MTIIKKILFICSLIAAAFTQVSAQIQDTTYSYYSVEQTTGKPVATEITIKDNIKTTVERFLTDTAEIIAVKGAFSRNLLDFTRNDYASMIDRQKKIDEMFADANVITEKYGVNILDTTGLAMFVKSAFTLKSKDLTGELIFKVTNANKFIVALGEEKGTFQYYPTFIRVTLFKQKLDFVPVEVKPNRIIWQTLEGHRLIQTSKK